MAVMFELEREYQQRWNGAKARADTTPKLMQQKSP
jgi:hypothetical protein